MIIISIHSMVDVITNSSTELFILDTEKSVEVVKDILKDELDFDFSGMAKPEVRKIPIKITTIQGSKGLSGDYVFITYFDDQYFIKNKDKKKISDKDIRNFLVALTRAREKVFLISSQEREPTFLKWINEERIETI